MDIRSLLNDYSIRYAYPGDRHYKPGWLNLPCPFCSGHGGNHLGYNISKNHFTCFRCGFKPLSKVLMRILGISYSETKRIIKEYKGQTRETKTAIKVVKIAFKMPDDTKPLLQNKMAIQYLMEKRSFTRQQVHWITKRFHLQATGFMGWLDDLDLSYRIIAPIFHNGEIVSWQSRDYTDESSLKYITCPAIVEITEHKEVLYNAPNPIKYPIVVLCEGIIDVWKVMLAGFPATCCFGVEYKPRQLALLKRYKKVIMFMDPDPAGKRAAKRLKRQLIFAGIQAHKIQNIWGKDPGEMHIKLIEKILNPLMDLEEV